MTVKGYFALDRDISLLTWALKEVEVIAVASGKLCKAEKLGQRDFCIFKIGINF